MGSVFEPPPATCRPAPERQAIARCFEAEQGCGRVCPAAAPGRIPGVNMNTARTLPFQKLHASEDLALAEQDIVEMEERIVRQSAVVEGLVAAGHDPAPAEQQLLQLRRALALLSRHRDLLLDEVPAHPAPPSLLARLRPRLPTFLGG
jgi:hypothetical protein